MDHENGLKSDHKIHTRMREKKNRKRERKKTEKKIVVRFYDFFLLEEKKTL